MRSSIHEALLHEFARWPQAVAGPVEQSEVDTAEQRLGVVLPEDVREFLLRYGGAVVRGQSLLGLRKAPLAPDDPASLVEQSARFQSELPAQYARMIVISVDDSGNPVGFLPDDRSIFVFDHNFGGRHDLATTFEEYLSQLLST